MFAMPIEFSVRRQVRRAAVSTKTVEKPIEIGSHLAPPALRLASVVAASVMMTACAPPDAPSTVRENGKISEIRNCPSSNPAYKVECLLLTCEKALFEKGTIPAYARIVHTRSNLSISYTSDKPERSAYQVKFPDGDKFRYAMCEMDGNNVYAMYELAAREQDW